MKEDAHTLFIPGPAGRLEALVAGFHEATNSLHQKEFKFNNKKPVGVICHPHPLYQGTLHNKVVTTIAKTWAEMGLATVRFNFRGVGLSEGEHVHGKGEIEDLEAVLNWLLEQGIHRLWLGGFSFGAFISAEVTIHKKYPVDALLSVAPPLRFFAFAKDKVPEVPWIIIHGEQDELVPYEEVVTWYQEIKRKKSDVQLISFENTSHFFHGRLTDLKQAILQTMSPFLI